MPVLVTWLVENHVIMTTSYGEVTIDDLEIANRAVVALIQEGIANGAECVHLFNDVSRVQKQVNPLQVRRMLSLQREPGVGNVVSGGSGNPMVNYFMRFISKLVGVPIDVFESPEHALQSLMQRDRTLPDLHALYREQRGTP